MAANTLTARMFAKLVGASPSAVGKWVRGERLPRARMMHLITKTTGGKVLPSDFYPDSPVGALVAAQG